MLRQNPTPALIGRLCRGERSVRPEHARHSGRREDQRLLQRLTQDGDRLVAPGHVGQHAREQSELLKIALICTQRDFVLGTAVDEIEQGARQPAPGEPAQVFDIGNDHRSLFRDRP